MSNEVKRSAELREIVIENYRSIGPEGVRIQIPATTPLVLTGENNAGKSNIVRAIGLILGEGWPGSFNPDDHDFFGRSPDGVDIRIEARLRNIKCPECSSGWVNGFVLSHSSTGKPPTNFRFQCDFKEHKYMSNELRSNFQCVVVGTNRDISYQMSYGSRWTSLSKLMKRFHARLIVDEDRVDRLKEFQNQLVSTFYEVEEFRAFAEELKSAAGRLSGNMTHGLDFDFSSFDASNYFRSLRIYPHVDSSPRSFDELGTGQGQILTIAFSYAYAKAFGGEGLVMAVEEPEAHLHPLSQQWVAAKLSEICKDGAQVIITTHSPYFVNLANPGATVLVTKDAETGATSCTQLSPRDLSSRVIELGGVPERSTADAIGQYYEDSATLSIKSGLFARCCVLVEGATESGALPELLTRAGWPTSRVGIDVISVSGIDNIAKWVRYFLAQGITVYPIFDTDRDRPSEERKNISARLEILLAVGLLGDHDWDTYVGGPLGIHDAFAVFDPHFEGAMRSIFGTNYSELESEAGDRVGKSKPLRARYIARRLDFIENRSSEPSFPWNPILRLAECLYLKVDAASYRSEYLSN